MTLAVRRRPTFPGFQKLLGLVAVVAASILFVAGGVAAPGSAYGILFIVVGALGAVYSGVVLLRAAGTAFSTRETLILDDDGVLLPRRWPLPPGDRRLRWADLAAVCAWSQGPPTGGRGAALNQLYLSFLPARDQDSPREVPSGAELLATKVADLPCSPTLRYTLAVRPGWDATVEQIVQEAQRHTPDVPFVDRRELPKPRRKAKRPPTPTKPS